MNQFLGALNPTLEQVEEISISQTGLREFLYGRFMVDRDFLAGSYRRSTMVRQSRDVDVFLALNNTYLNGTYAQPGYRYQERGPANLLNRVRAHLQERYGRT